MNLFCSLLAIPEQFGIAGGIVDGEVEGLGVGFKVTVGAGDGDAVGLGDTLALGSRVGFTEKPFPLFQ